MKPYERLKKLGACEEAVAWAKSYKTNQAAWDACEDGSWMLWYVGRMSGKPGSSSRRKLILVATKCARLSWKFVRKEDSPTIKKCYQIAERYAAGEATLSEVSAAANAAHAAACAANAADNAAANAAAYAADCAAAYAAAYAAANAAACAAHAAANAAAHAAAYAAAYAAANAAACAAAYAAANAAHAAAYAAARKKTLAQCADIVREFYPTPPLKDKP